MNDANVSTVTYQQMTYQQTGVAYPEVRDDRSTVNTKTGYDDDDDDVLGCADEMSDVQTQVLTSWMKLSHSDYT